MAAKLIAEEGPLKGLELSFEEGDEWVIGRDPDMCQMLVEDSAVSRRQLKCTRTPQGIEVENLSATNPSRLNGQEMSAPSLLKHGDALKLGSTIFYFYTQTGASVDASHALSRVDKTSGGSADSELSEHGYDTIYGEDEEGPLESLADIDFDLTKSGRWLLKVLSGPHSGAEFAMQTGTSYVIGTDPTACDIIFHDVSVSRQHARINVGAGDTLEIEDLNSRNGIVIDGEKVIHKKTIPSNTIVALGTTNFVVFDREGRRETIISPLLPSLVKVLQKEEKVEEEKKSEATEKDNSPPPPPVISEAEIQAKIAQEAHLKQKSRERTFNVIGAAILLGMLLGLLIIVGIGVSSLFETKEIVQTPVNFTQQIDQALVQFPKVKYTFNDQTGNLLLVGHVLTGSDHTQILYNLQSLPFVKNINDNIVIDELIWQEMNQILAKNPDWRSVIIQAPEAGRFVLSGYLKTKKQAETLSDYVSTNFRYPGLLEKRIIVEEDVISQVKSILQDAGFSKVEPKLSNGEITLNGHIPSDTEADLEKVLQRIKAIPGVRVVNNYVAEQAPEQSLINLTDKYPVSGQSFRGNDNITVVINGRILSQGDTLDGMTITSIKRTAIYLEKDGVKYRIDYNK